MDARDRYDALKAKHDELHLRNRKEEMVALKEAYEELAFEVNGIITPYIDKFGREVLDPNPIAPPVGFQESESISDRLRAMIEGERMRRAAELAEMDTFEEADDFEVDDDPIPMRDSPYENDRDVSIREMVNEGNRSLSDKRRKADAEAAEAAKVSGSPNKPAPPQPGSDARRLDTDADRVV